VATKPAAPTAHWFRHNAHFARISLHRSRTGRLSTTLLPLQR